MPMSWCRVGRGAHLLTRPFQDRSGRQIGIAGARRKTGRHLPAWLRSKATVARSPPGARRVPEADQGLSRRELSKSCTWIERLNEIDTSSIEPMASVAA